MHEVKGSSRSKLKRYLSYLAYAALLIALVVIGEMYHERNALSKQQIKSVALGEGLSNCQRFESSKYDCGTIQIKEVYIYNPEYLIYGISYTVDLRKGGNETSTMYLNRFGKVLSEDDLLQTT